MRGAFRDRHGSRGGMRWTRQRRAGTKVAGRKPGGRARALYKGCAQGPEAREGFSLRRTTALRGADRGGDVPHWHRLCAPAQVVWSFEIRTALRAPATAGPKYRGDDGVRFRPLPGRARSKPEAHCARNAGRCPVRPW